MGIRYSFDDCPRCHRAGSGNQSDMCNDCYVKHVIGYRVSSNSLEFRVEKAVKEIIGWWIFKTETVTWEPVDKDGNVQSYDEPYFDDDYDIEYYETIEDAKVAIQKFVNRNRPTKPPIITRMSEWKPV